MRLTKLAMHGFKSFADDTELGFGPGVTAIVGPNGCGKSNISDAVRWVLGEQRPRALRGAKMDEVIFQGSSIRRAVNIAEVSLHFDNTDGALPIAYREVVLTRRLSRSGESDYLLNGSSCRLRDIQDLVRGTGLGADAGVVIESRMIDALLSDRPDDRRELFEEAAGIGLYRDRRRSTERRLEETSVDISRLDDLIGEVQSQVRSLARQRKRAERHAELSARRFTIEIALADREMAAWSDELLRLEGTVAELRTAAPATEQQEGAAEQGRESAHQARAAADTERSDLAREVGGLREAMLQLQGDIAVAEERQQNALARRQRAEEERRTGDAHGSRLAYERERAAAEHAELLRQVDEARTTVGDHAAEETRARETLAAARGARDTADAAIREGRARLGRLDLDGAAAQREIDEIDQRLRRLTTEHAPLLTGRDAMRAELGRAEEERAAAEAAHRAADTALAHALEETHAARRRETEARSEFLLAEEASVGLAGTVAAVEGLERERVGLAPAASRLLRERESFGEGAILGPVSDFISAETTDAAVVERYLGATVHAIVVRDRGVADSVRAWHRAANPGPLLLLPLDATPTPAATLTPASLAHLVRAAEPAHAWVTALLGDARALEDESGFTDARGAVWLPGPSGGAGPLRRRAELSTLRAQLAAAADRRSRAAAALDAARHAAETAGTTFSTAQDAAGRGGVEARRAAERATDAQRRLERLEREIADADVLRARIEERRETIGRAADVVRADSLQLREAISAQETAAVAIAATLAAAERAYEDARDRYARSQVADAQVVARLEIAAERARRLSEEHGSASARLAALDSELAELATADGVLGRQRTDRATELETRRAAAAIAETRLAEAERRVHALEDEVVSADHALDSIRHRATALRDDLHHAELRLTELGGRRTAIRERLEAEWRRPLAEMLADVQPLEMDDAALRAEAEDIRTQMDALGPVNPLAIEEHGEESKRADFLVGQRADLASAQLSLQQALREIDATAKDLFLTAFAHIRDNFRRTFQTLFGGGECDLQLADPNAPLECDIEIHASPRGKRTQRIHLLSSGEKALVALALLFGIFLSKPSPFCLLDEVDAPLDDSNIGRYVRLLTEFKANTQFIVITHNPRTTVEAADAVYGITMQDPGVSSIVGVKLRDTAIEEAIAGRIRAAEGVPTPV